MSGPVPVIGASEVAQPVLASNFTVILLVLAYLSAPKPSTLNTQGLPPASTEIGGTLDLVLLLIFSDDRGSPRQHLSKTRLSS